ncbi:hypothetical protein G646_gp070 [Serratia phage phiMAM1]|uniref:Uncharacterized protein n=2 Tax=Miltonvirus MAM1 TaxID=2169689 RepID=K7Z9L9_9CAUD|nr:hypothetical protein G646_gp070 [Serratia phage phiMAM1]AFX93538.1 hypothetical protein MAM_070 [Serratia phage phiMAM1]ASZ78843.1 hypothetical protein 2050H1_077 [Serratia phage 2050H1]
MGLFLTLLFFVLLAIGIIWVFPILVETWDEQIEELPLSNENRTEWLRGYRKRLIRNIRYHLPF